MKNLNKSHQNTDEKHETNSKINQNGSADAQVNSQINQVMKKHADSIRICFVGTSSIKRRQFKIQTGCK